LATFRQTCSNLCWKAKVFEDEFLGKKVPYAAAAGGAGEP